ncbi:MAG: DUF4159 domain-containing protein [Planctomycetota bacterium]
MIPHRDRIVLGCVLPLGVLGALVPGFALRAAQATVALQYSSEPHWAHAFGETSHRWQIWIALALATLLGLYIVAAALRAVLMPGPHAHRMVRRAFVASYILLIGAAVYGLMITGWAASYTPNPFKPEPWKSTEDLERFWYQLPYWFLPLLAVGLFAALHVRWLRGAAQHAYGVITDPGATDTASGELIVEDLRSFGRDPRYRKSWLASLVLHLLVIVLPLLFFRGCGMLRNIRPPGRGVPAAQMKTVQKQKKEKKKEIIVSEKSPVIFDQPKVEDSQVLEEVTQEAQQTYKVSAAGAPGNQGEGGPGEGGWMGEVGGALTFIRLRDVGRGWDDGMQQNADRNFLRWYRENTAVTFDVEENGRAIDPSDLDRYEVGYAPPFVYMTGSDRVRMSRGEQDILKDYLFNRHGLLFADAGSSGWHKSFTRFIHRVTGKSLAPISKDDVIYRQPITLPDGNDPLWAHGGERVLGIKHEGRWCVIYHPGDVNDVWKDGASGVSDQLRENGFAFGCNVVYYAYRQYTLYAMSLRE